LWSKRSKELGLFDKPVPPPEPEPVEVVVEESEEAEEMEERRIVDDFSDMEEVPLNQSERSSFNPYAKKDSKNSSFISMDGY
jgi:hypothetical protein